MSTTPSEPKRHAEGQSLSSIREIMTQLNRLPDGPNFPADRLEELIAETDFYAKTMPNPFLPKE